MLGVSKIVENMELGHNVMHGQWDWMNDPEVHSTGWEWDNTGPSAHWKHTHNYIHHKYTNVLGMDDDVGYGLIRVTRDQRWKPFNLGNIAYNTLLMLFFQYGVAVQHLELGRVAAGKHPDTDAFKKDLRDVGMKIGRQVGKDYVVYPALVGAVTRSRKNWLPGDHCDLRCQHDSQHLDQRGHLLWTFPRRGREVHQAGPRRRIAGPLVPAADAGQRELRLRARPLAFMSGNLSYQIEHHLFPDLPSNRYAEIAVRVRALCDKYDLPYTTGPFLLQYAKSWRTIAKLSLPNKYLKGTVDDAPETASERRFKTDPEQRLAATIDPATGRRTGLRTAIGKLRRRRSPVPAIAGQRPAEGRAGCLTGPARRRRTPYAGRRIEQWRLVVGCEARLGPATTPPRSYTGAWQSLTSTNTHI